MRQSAHKMATLTRDALASTKDEENGKNETSQLNPTPSQKETTEDEDGDILVLQEEEEIEAVQVSNIS